MQLFFHAQQFLRLFFLDAGYGYAGPAAHHVLDIFAAHNARRRIVEVILVAQSTQVFALLAFFIRIEPRLLEFVIRNRRIHAVHNELDPLLNFGNLFRQRGLTQLHPRARFINQVDRLVRKEPIRNVPVRMRHRELNRRIRITDRVKLLIAVLDAVDDLDRVRLVRWRNLHSLEAPLQRAIFLD